MSDDEQSALEHALPGADGDKPQVPADGRVPAADGQVTAADGRVPPDGQVPSAAGRVPPAGQVPPAGPAAPAAGPDQQQGNTGKSPAAGRGDRGEQGGSGPEGGKSARAEAKTKRKQRGSFLRELPILVVIALALALTIKTYAFQAYYIPSGSMQNTLAIGDKVLVNKIVFHLRAIHRGDVVVFNGQGSWNPGPSPVTQVITT